VINMAMTLSEKLKDIYVTYKDDEDPPVPVDSIKELLELLGVPLEDGDEIENR